MSTQLCQCSFQESGGDRPIESGDDNGDITFWRLTDGSLDCLHPIAGWKCLKNDQPRIGIVTRETIGVNRPAQRQRVFSNNHTHFWIFAVQCYEALSPLTISAIAASASSKGIWQVPTCLCPPPPKRSIRAPTSAVQLRFRML